MPRGEWLAGGNEAELRNSQLVWGLNQENERLSKSMARLQTHLNGMNRLLRSKAVTTLKKGFSKFRRTRTPKH